MINLSKELDFNLEQSGSGYKWEVAHFPRYTSPWTKEIAEEVKQQILNDHEKAREWDDLALDKEDKDIALHGAKLIKQNQKLREVIEKSIKENERYRTDPDSGGLYYELKQLLEDSKK